MTYTTVFKDYDGVTFEEAAARMLRDPEVFAQGHGSGEESYGQVGEQIGYSIESWSWTVETGKHRGVLRVNFR
jgi:hypothetical protein